MADDEQATAATCRRRGRGPEASARAGALERLKALRHGGRRSETGGFQIKMEDRIYDTVGDDEYDAIVAKRREEVRGFIVDDNGLGYCDEGEEEDWTRAGPSSDESDGGDRPKRKKVEKKEKDKDKEPRPKKPNSSLTAAAAMMGKQRLSSMFTSSIFGKNRDNERGKGLNCDSIVDDVIAEFAPDENDREKRRGQLNKIFVLNSSVKSEIGSDRGVNIAMKVELDRVVASGSDSVVGSVQIYEGVEENEGKKEVVFEVSDPPIEEIHDFSEREGAIEEKNVNFIEEKVEPVKKKEEVFTLNAKIKEDNKDPSLSAMAGWKAVRTGGDGNVGGSVLEVNSGSNNEELLQCDLEEDGSLPFYMIDAYEEFYGANMGKLYLFGKAKAGSSYQSCCVVVENMQRCVYAIPNSSVFHSDEIMKLEKDAEESRISSREFRTKLHDMASGLKSDIAKKLLDQNVSAFSMAPVKRNYAFERSDIPAGENYVLKINYPFKDPRLPADLKGETFHALLGTHSSALELFLVKRKIKGPSWLSVSGSEFRTVSQRVSNCPKKTAEAPPVVVTAISLKTINFDEIVSASVICCHKAKIDTPVLASEWTRPGMLSHFTVVRKLDGGIFPMGFTKEATEKNSKAGSNVLSIESTWGLLAYLILKGSCQGIMSCISGRLLCDTYLCSRDLLREVSYSLTQLAKTQLNKDRKEILPHEIPRMFQKSEFLMELIEYGETDAWLSMELMFHLSVLPLTRQLTKISGNLWGKTLQGARAQRVEYLLLHAFHAKKYIVPDKMHLKETNSAKRKTDNGVDDKNVDELDVNFDNDAKKDHGKGKKGPAYAGGLVLEPKRGLYDKYILLLDFNSLYPSIIQEYNICFTTVERSSEGLAPRLPSSKKIGLLPELLKDLVERRRNVKKWMKTASGLKIQQLDIQQQALKLTANSMYGCLGFPNSRFYAKPLAELITLQGREILQSTVDLVQNNLNLEVIYGDTDSIMIYSGLDDIAKAKAIARKVIQEVNKKYRCLEIDLDGLYKRMLLLKKKKYAAVKVQFKNEMPYEVIERKGLDMVRRDWSLLSKEMGDFCLSQILSGGSCEDVVESIHDALMKVQEEMRNGQVALEKYVITKSLTKPPEAYPDAKNQPHVQVALRLKQSGYSAGCSAGDTVPYIICCEQGTSLGNSTVIAQRARHPDELKREDGKWMIDIDYYLSQQIHPVVSRLCASIQGTSPGRLADCLGLDSSKFKGGSSEAVRDDPSNLSLLDDEERFRGCEPLILACPSCSDTFSCPTILNSISMSITKKQAKSQAEESTSDFWYTLRCAKCPGEGDMGRLSPVMIANQVKRQVDGFVSMYYRGFMTCDDESCQYNTRSLNLRLVGNAERGTVCPDYPRCNGRLVRKYTEADVYKQLSFFCHVLDTVRCIEKTEASPRLPVEMELAKLRSVVNLAASTVQMIRDRCAYGWIQLQDLCITV
ncbi:hypothetical protein C1H46_021707 [Malus baccata]|uniref:DNA polymerase n=1 Tax=Malus baccata TaxID=106549 RepID=A0A540M1U1_MALBA|nr:hypothetical protein C1H46_021707 [Malus baccata]